MRSELTFRSSDNLTLKQGDVGLVLLNPFTQPPGKIAAGILQGVMDQDRFLAVGCLFLVIPMGGWRRQVGDAVGKLNQPHFPRLLPDSLQAVWHLLFFWEQAVFRERQHAPGHRQAKLAFELLEGYRRIFERVVQKRALHCQVAVKPVFNTQGGHYFHAHQADVGDVGQLRAGHPLAVVG